MKSLEQLIGLAGVIFDENSELQTLHATEDGQFFVDKNRANLHANSPKKEDKKAMKVYEIKREDVESTGNDKLKQLENLELVSANYKEMRELVKHFEIEVEDFKADTLIKALIEFKQKQ